MSPRYRQELRTRLGRWSAARSPFQVSCHLPNFQRRCAQPSEKPLSARENNNLYFVAGLHQNVKHTFNAVIGRKGERVVEDDGCGPALSKQ
jgi:hypothetical protein